MKYTLGFIGCGNMGGALVQAAAKSLQGDKIAVCDRHNEKLEKLETAFGAVRATAKEIARESRFVILGVKSQAMQTTVAEIADILQKRTDAVVVTMAAGLSIRAIRSFIGGDLPVIRIMPNTPVAVNRGMILYATEDLDEAAEKDFLSAFEKAGLFDKLPEALIDAGSALSGCGPAFAYAFAQGLAKGGAECGLSAEKAAVYTAQTLLGAAEMLLTYGDPNALIKAVCSPGGTTIEGIRALQTADFEEITAQAVKAAYKRTLELKK